MNYYFDELNINNELYYLEFDVRSMKNGENHYRVRKLEKINNKKAEVSTGSTNIGTLPVTETSAFSNGNIPQSNNNVKSDILLTINNMRNIEATLINNIKQYKNYKKQHNKDELYLADLLK